MIGESILLDSIYGRLLIRSKRIPAEEQYRLIMECRQSGLTAHQWYEKHDIKLGTFYNWVKQLRQKVVWIYQHQPDAAIALRKVRKLLVDFHDTDTLSYEQLLNMILHLWIHKNYTKFYEI